MKVIYLYTNLKNGMQYVGQTQNLQERNRFHKKNYSDTYFDRAYHKHPEDFKLEIIRSFHDDVSNDTLNYWECYFIKKLNTKNPNGYNLTDGGDGQRGFKKTEETKEKMRQSMNDFYKTEKGIQTKEQISKKLMGHIITEQTRNKISNTLKGRFSGKNNICSKKCRCIELDLIFDSVGEAERWLRNNNFPKASHSNICNCCNGKAKTTCGYHWEYVQEVDIYGCDLD